MIKAATATMTLPTATSNRFARTTSISSPPGNCATNAAMAPALKTKPMSRGSQPRSAKNTATKGPNPASAPAMKKFTASSA